MMKAKKLNDISRTFTDKPLDETNFDEYYVPCDQARGIYYLDRLVDHLMQNKENRTKVAFIGHKGCGKSTELYRLSQLDEIKENFWFCSFSVVSEYGSQKINTVSLLILMMEKLFRRALDDGLELDKELMKSIYDWTCDVTLEKEEKRDLGSALETEAKAGFDFPFLGLLAQIKGYFKYNVESKKRILQKIENRIDELRARCDTLIKQIRAALDERRILLVVEDLDKYPPQEIKEMFATSSRILFDLSANIIYTMPIPLMVASGGPALKSEFSYVYTLNMIKTHHKDGSVVEEGIQAVRNIIFERMDEELITPEALDYVIQISGGVLRHLFTIMVEASYLAKRNTEEYAGKITKQNIKSAAHTIANDFKRSLVDKSEEKRNILKQIEKNKSIDQISVEDSTIPLEMMQDLLIVEYQNDEIWQESHPIFKELF
jgi:GTPase SAR1 family protein